MTLTGGSLTNADINLKLPRAGKDFYQNTSIKEDAPWRLPQVQDSANQLQLAVTELGRVEEDREFKYDMNKILFSFWK